MRSVITNISSVAVQRSTTALSSIFCFHVRSSHVSHCLISHSALLIVQPANFGSVRCRCLVDSKLQITSDVRHLEDMHPGYLSGPAKCKVARCRAFSVLNASAVSLLETFRFPSCSHNVHGLQRLHPLLHSLDRLTIHQSQDPARPDQVVLAIADVSQD